MNKIRDERKVTTDTTKNINDHKRVIQNYMPVHWTLNKWLSLWKTYHFLRLKSSRNLNRMITSKDIETVIKISQTTKTQDQMSSLQVSINIQRRFNFYFQNIFLKT